MTILDARPVEFTETEHDHGPYLIVAEWRFANVRVLTETDELLVVQGDAPCDLTAEHGMSVAGRGHRTEWLGYWSDDTTRFSAEHGDALRCSFAAAVPGGKGDCFRVL